MDDLSRAMSTSALNVKISEPLNFISLTKVSYLNFVSLTTCNLTKRFRFYTS